MIKVTVLYGHPADPAAFEKAFAVHVREHGPRILHALELDFCKAVSLDGSQPAHYRTTDIWFRDLAALGESMRSPGTQGAIADVASFATGGMQMIVTEVTTVEGAGR